MEWEFNSTQFKDDAEWSEAIRLYRWRNRINQGHYERRKGVLYFDIFCYNMLLAEISRRKNLGEDGIGKRF